MRDILATVLGALGFLAVALPAPATEPGDIGREVAVARHLRDGEEFKLSIPDFLAHGRQLFSANWTVQEGGGRPLTKGDGAPLVDADDPLIFPRNFNRVSGPDANSCVGCHNAPFGIPGGGGDIVANVFVLGQRFDFATFDRTSSLSPLPAQNMVDERGVPVSLQTIGNSRATLGMFGSGYIEMLARQMTAELQAIRDATAPGQSSPLIAKGVSFGVLGRNADGTWDTAGVEGLPATSLGDHPNLIIRPFHQAGAVVSLRMFTNSAFNQHHGIQAAERFGKLADLDGDGVISELTRADVTAASIFQATMAVPGRVIPNDPVVEKAVRVGEERFGQIGCAGCHVPSLPLTDKGWIFTEPNPYNPRGNLQPGEAPVFSVNLNGDDLPRPRLHASEGVVDVPAYTDLKLHDMCDGPDDPNAEALDMNRPLRGVLLVGGHPTFSTRKFIARTPTPPGFFAGNCKFITRKLWGTANEPPYFHHGQFTTLREAILAHRGEAVAARRAFETMETYEQNSVIEFLKTLQILPPGTKDRVVDEHYRKKTWPPRG